MAEIGSTKYAAGVSIDSTTTGATAPFTAVEGTTYSIDMSTGSPSADLVITLPTPTQGNACAFVISGEDVTYGVEFIGTIGTVAYSSGGTYRLASTGDHVVFRYVDATIGWKASSSLGGRIVDVETFSSSDTLDANNEVCLCDTTSGVLTLNLPAAASYTGRVYQVKKTSADANTVVIDGNASETIDGGLTATLTTQYESITIVSDGSNWFII